MICSMIRLIKNCNGAGCRRSRDSSVFVRRDPRYLSFISRTKYCLCIRYGLSYYFLMYKTSLSNESVRFAPVAPLFIFIKIRVSLLSCICKPFLWYFCTLFFIMFYYLWFLPYLSMTLRIKGFWLWRVSVVHLLTFE